MNVVKRIEHFFSWDPLCAPSLELVRLNIKEFPDGDTEWSSEVLGSWSQPWECLHALRFHGPECSVVRNPIHRAFSPSEIIVLMLENGEHREEAVSGYERQIVKF